MIRISTEGAFIYRVTALTYFYDPNELSPKGVKLKTFRRELRYMFEDSITSDRSAPTIIIETFKIDFMLNWLNCYEKR